MQPPTNCRGSEHFSDFGGPGFPDFYSQLTGCLNHVYCITPLNAGRRLLVSTLVNTLVRKSMEYLSPSSSGSRVHPDAKNFGSTLVL